MEFTLDISWPALFLIFVVIGLIIDPKDNKKSKTMNKFETEKALDVLKEYQKYFEEFLTKNIESNKKLTEENKKLRERIHNMQTRSMVAGKK